jgi:hypothetical protein
VTNEKAAKRLTSFFYNLLRDHVPPADIEKILQEDERLMWDRGVTEDRKAIADKEVTYSNPYLRDYAADIVGRFFGIKSNVKKRISEPRPM